MRCSHLPLYTGFTIDLYCVPLVCALLMYTDAETVMDFLLSLLRDTIESFILSLTIYVCIAACLSDEGVVIEILDGEDEAGILTSPGYPYIVPEHSECRWILNAPEGKVCHARSQRILFYNATRKYSSRMRTTRFCSFGGGVWYPPDTLAPLQDTLPPDTLLLRYPNHQIP